MIVIVPVQKEGGEGWTCKRCGTHQHGQGFCCGKGGEEKNRAGAGVEEGNGEALCLHFPPPGNTSVAALHLYGDPLSLIQPLGLLLHFFFFFLILTPPPGMLMV